MLDYVKLFKIVYLCDEIYLRGYKKHEEAVQGLVNVPHALRLDERVLQYKAI